MYRHAAILLLISLVNFGPTPPARPSDYGVLLMAHGGSEEWDQTIIDAVAPIAAEMPVEIAFGMADAERMQTAVDALVERGDRRIGVVRLFVDGDSFLERTEKILGLRPGAPPVAKRQAGPIPGMQMWLYRIESPARFAVSREGLDEAPETSIVIRDRAAALSTTPDSEVLMLIAHGAGTEAQNAAIERQGRARLVLAQHELGFADVVVRTLAEDWSDLRAQSEAAIRDDIEQATAAGRTTLVVPLRVSGFGPYAEVLESIDYRADGIGLLPHPLVIDWIRRQALELRHRFVAADH